MCFAKPQILIELLLNAEGLSLPKLGELQQCASDIKHFRLQDFEITGTQLVSQHPGFECGLISSAYCLTNQQQLLKWHLRRIMQRC